MLQQTPGHPLLGYTMSRRKDLYLELSIPEGRHCRLEPREGTEWGGPRPVSATTTLERRSPKSFINQMLYLNVNI